MRRIPAGADSNLAASSTSESVRRCALDSSDTIARHSRSQGGVSIWSPVLAPEACVRGKGGHCRRGTPAVALRQGARGSGPLAATTDDGCRVPGAGQPGLAESGFWSLACGTPRPLAARSHRYAPPLRREGATPHNAEPPVEVAAGPEIGEAILARHAKSGAAGGGGVATSEA